MPLYYLTRYKDSCKTPMFIHSSVAKIDDLLSIKGLWILWFVGWPENWNFFICWHLSTHTGLLTLPIIFKWNDALDFCFAADIVEGMVNKGIFLNGDKGGTFLHFGNYQNSCISDPTLCGPKGKGIWHNHTNHLKTISSLLYWWLWLIFHYSLGITFSFFWKNYEAESRFAVASGGKVISNGFSVFTNPYGGYVEFYTRGNNHRWKADIRVPGIVNEFAFVTVLF